MANRATVLPILPLPMNPIVVMATDNRIDGRSVPRAKAGRITSDRLTVTPVAIGTYSVLSPHSGNQLRWTVTHRVK
jgi:hypothetical protein